MYSSLTSRFYAASKIVLCIEVLCASCACAPVVPLSSQRPTEFARWTDTPPEYRIGTSDEISVRFPYNPELNTTGPVGPDGRFDLPLIGSVAVADQSPTSLSSKLDHVYSSQIRLPAITVSVVRYGHQRVYVGGEVRNTGTFPIDGQANVLDEIMIAGGMLDTARAHEVVLIRRGADGRQMLRTIDIPRFIRTGDMAQDVPVHAQDIIFVPKSSIAEVDLWMDQFLNKGLPFNKSLDYVVTGGSAVIR